MATGGTLFSILQTGSILHMLLKRHGNRNAMVFNGTNRNHAQAVVITCQEEEHIFI